MWYAGSRRRFSFAKTSWGGLKQGETASLRSGVTHICASGLYLLFPPTPWASRPSWEEASCRDGSLRRHGVQDGRTSLCEVRLQRYIAGV
jgi:hypothetical protein